MLAVQHIRKKMGDKAVLNDISFTVSPAMIYGLIGYNGVGKTTLLKILSGIYRQDSGQVTMEDQPVFENEAVKRKIFLMTEEFYFLPQARLSDMEKFYRGYYPDWDGETYDKLIDLFELPRSKRLREYSKGMQRQAALTAAFSAGAAYLFLDEAFDGLDLGVRINMRKLLRQYADKREATVILTSHNLAELEACVDRFGMLHEGKLLCDKTVEEILKQDMHLEEFFLQEKEEKIYDWETFF